MGFVNQANNMYLFPGYVFNLPTFLFVENS